MPTKALYSWHISQTEGDWTFDGAWWGAVLNAYCTGFVDLYSQTLGDLVISSAVATRAVDAVAYVDVDISAYSTDIDAGNLSYDWGGWCGDLPSDKGNYAIEFYDVSDVIIGSRISGSPVDAGCTWTEQRLTGTVPANARSARLILYANYGSGGSNNAIFDDMDFLVSGPNVDPADTKITQAARETLISREPTDAKITSMSRETLVTREPTDVKLTQFARETLILRDLNPSGGTRKAMNAAVIC